MGQAHRSRSSETYIKDVRLENPVRNGIYRRLSLCDTAFLTCAISSQEQQLMFSSLLLLCDCKMSDYVCEELIIEIFTRLPVKSLLRFRSVSKSLCSIIGSPGFIRMHTLRSRLKLLIKHITERGCGFFYTIHSEDQLPMSAGYRYNGIAPIKFPYEYPFIVGSCNGIFCLYDLENNITLWNPSVRRNLALPDCPTRDSYMLDIGFGFDPIADDYKVVVLPKTHNCENGISHVYAMKIDTWCAIASPIPLFTNVTSRAYSFNGSLHWVVRRSFSHHILTFDLSTYAFGIIELPVPDIDNGPLTTFQGSLAMVYRDVDDIWMWVMKEYNNTASWSLVFKSKANQVKQEDLQQTSNGDFFLDMFCTGHQLWNTKIGRRLELVKFTPHSCMIDIKIFVESLQLLNIKGSGSQ